MFNFGYALIGFLCGFLLGFGIENSTNSEKPIDVFTSLILVFSLGFLLFSATFGFEWLLAGILEVVAGVFVGSMLSKK